MKRDSNSEKGFSLVEALVAITMLNVVGLAAVAFMSKAFGDLSLQSRGALASQEVTNAVKLLSSELRMARSASPYLPGTDPTLVDCTARISVAGDTIRFLVPHEDSSSTTGLSSYYVGYRYDSTTEQLFRGSVQAASTTSCNLPATDPLASNKEQLLAERIVPIDANGDGTNEPIFARSGSQITINLGIKVSGKNSTEIVQKLSTVVRIRVS